MAVHQYTSVFGPRRAGCSARIPRLAHKQNAGVDDLLTGEGSVNAFRSGGRYAIPISKVLVPFLSSRTNASVNVENLGNGGAQQQQQLSLRGQDARFAVSGNLVFAIESREMWQVSMGERTKMMPWMVPLNASSQSGTNWPLTTCPLSPSLCALLSCPAANAGSPRLSLSPT
jgi:hypothetical protein